MKTCRHDGTPLIEKQTKRTPEQLKKAYYYTAYYLCPKCHRIYHDEKFKVENTGHTPLFTTGTSLKHPDIEIWTDGACSNNGRDNAKAAWAFVTKDYEEGGHVAGKQTNNTAEALAVYHALQFAVDQGYNTIRLHTDSQITLHGVAKRAILVKNNREIFEKIEELIAKHSLIVHWVKVLGHSGDKNNERADRLANKLAGIRNNES